MGVRTRSGACRSAHRSRPCKFFSPWAGVTRCSVFHASESDLIPLCRCGITPDSLTGMRESIVQAVSAYVDIETEEEIEVNLSTDPELGTIYSVAVPVRRVKSRRIGGVDTSEDGKIIVKVRGDSSGGLFSALQALMAWGLGMRSSTLSRRVACPVCFGPLTLTSLPCSGIQRTPTAIPATSSPLACEVPDARPQELWSRSNDGAQHPATAHIAL